MRRGEIWWADLPPPLGHRPVVLLSRDAAYAVRTSVTVAPVTTHIRGIRSEVRLGPEDGLPRPSVVNLDGIITIPKASLQRRAGLVRLDKLQAVSAAIHHALELED
jgi:mRNA interferase MazF